MLQSMELQRVGHDQVTELSDLSHSLNARVRKKKKMLA